MKFRPATPSDAPRIAALILSHRAVLTVDPTGQGAEEFFEQVSVPAVRGYIDSPRYAYLVADDGDDLAGFIAIRDHEHLYHLFVASGHQRRGLGRRLWDEARRQAESAGNTGGFTVNASPNAVPVYARFGFEPVGPRTEKHGVAFVPMRLGAVTSRPAREADAEGWLEMRCALWPEGPEAEHRDEIARFFGGSLPRQPWAVLLAERDGRLLGFTELSIRPFAEGCRSHRVAYLEGWFVRPEARRQGVGRALVAAAEGWGRAQGCTEFASDTDPDNDVSSSAHRALGFAEAGLVRCFRKEL